MRRSSHPVFITMVSVTLALQAPSALAATPTVDQAIRLKPLQKDVDFDTPAAADLAKCTIKVEKSGSATGWVVRDEAGQKLRRFLDTNADNKVDQWCYFKDGIEVYRDEDADFNGKADQYRWLGTAGIRWGTDKDEDGRIDSWKAISAEEVSAEFVAALQDRDRARFERLLLTAGELSSLGLGAGKAKDLREKTAEAGARFAEAAPQQSLVNEKTRWLHFGATRPGAIPAGTDGSSNDLIVYENVVAVVVADDRHAQVPLGTLVQVGRCWRMIDLPASLLHEEVAAAAGGLFFQASLVRNSQGQQTPAAGLGARTQKLIGELEEVDRQLQGASAPAQRASLHARRAQLVEDLAEAAASDADRDTWLRQLADSVSAAVQSSAYPKGTERLKKLYDRLAGQAPHGDVTAFVKFRWLTAAYSQSLQTEEADFAKIQAKWLVDLEKFVADFPRGQDTPEAMLQLAIAQEFAGKEEDAGKWYARIVNQFPAAASAKKAAGAKTRLDSVGKTIRLKGTSTAGKTVDLARYKGRVALVHYWATWCEPCKRDLAVLDKLRTQYGGKGFSLIGVSLDNERTTLDEYLSKNPLPWPQLFEKGGLDNRLANELGILTLPTMILLDRQGKVVNRGIHIAELEGELKKLLR